ncbi:hypothetical protein UFOVP75_193 [uncultured Caudovirales phage]|uniref:Lipoprotein n=1 Tax=uncultured Caudovirales phage TaxID=2100421 RepID=A0A6J5KZE4_9CAUD|nr:hypothetical protein UFOVP75_193 [uncultured Caudovirales phage]
MKHYAFFLALLLSGCNVTPPTYVSTSDPTTPLRVVFVHDGCTMYEFSDAGLPHYFAHCKDGTVDVGSSQMVGDTNTPVNIQTVRTK